MDYEKRKVFLVNCAFLAVIGGIVYFLTKFVVAYLLPFVIGLLIAFAVQKPARFCATKTRFTSGTWAAIFVVGIYLILIGLLSLLVWQISAQFGEIAQILPQKMTGFSEKISGMQKSLSRFLSAFSSKSEGGDLIGQVTSRFFGFLTNFVTGAASSVAKNVPAFMLSTVVTVVASCYIAKDFDQLSRFFRGMLKEKTYRKFGQIKSIFTGSILKFATGYLILMAITFAELLIGFWILKVPYFVLVAALTALIDLLPVLGTGTVLLPWSAYWMLSGSLGKGIGLLVLYVIITVLRNFLEPRIIGNQVGMRPLPALITMFVGLRIGGIAGMMLLPIVFIVVIDYYKQQLKKEGRI